MIQGNVESIAMPEVDFGFDLVEDMAERLVVLAKRGEPVVRVLYKGEPAWLVVGYENVASVLANDAQIPAGAYFRRELDTLGHTLLQMEGDEHRVYKAAMSQPFAASAIRRRVQNLLLPLADKIIDDFGDRRELDLNESYGRRYGFNVISKLLGIPVPESQERELMDMVVALIQIKGPNTPPELRRARALAAVERTNDLLTPVIAARRSERRDDMISYLIDADIGGHSLSDDEIMDFIRSIYLAGADSTGLMLGNIMTVVLSHPGLKDKLLASPEKRIAAIDEIIRLEPVTGLLTRTAIKDTVVAGTTIPAGSQILLDVPGANRNSNAFANPEALSLERPRRTVSLSFGSGIHFCLGHHLAREELRVSVHRLLDRLPGLGLAGERGRPGGTTFRCIPQGVIVRFDRILSSAHVPLAA